MNTSGKLLLPGFLPRVHVDDVLLQPCPLFPVNITLQGRVRVQFVGTLYCCAVLAPQLELCLENTQ